MDAWAKSGEKEGAKRAQQIHDGIIEMYKHSGDPMIAPSTVSFNTMLNAWAKSSHPASLEMAENLFEDMMEWDDEIASPDVLTFSTLLDAYSRSRNLDAVEKAENLFQLMSKIGVQRNVYTFSALQNVYARSRRADAPEQCQRILERMIQQYKNGDVFAKPNCINYNAVLCALSRTRTKDAAEKAYVMLEKMERPDFDGGFDVEPDRLSYALAILACARCPDLVYGAERSERLLEKMEERARKEAKRRKEISSAAPPSVTLDLESFNVVLTAISKSRTADAVLRTLRIVKRMENYAVKGDSAVMPNTRSWNAVLHSLSRTHDKSLGGGEKAEQILNHMFELFRNGTIGAKPDAYSFAAVLNTYQTMETLAATERADEIVRHMEGLYEKGEIDSHPDTVHYSILCATWSKSNDRRAAHRVVDILSKMKEKDRAGLPNVRPNTRTYNSCLDALCRADETTKAEELLYHMLALTRDGDRDASPDAFSFNVVISGFARSRKRGSGQRAESVLDRFIEFSDEHPSVRPDTRSFTHIIAHYARAKNMPDAPYRAENILNQLVSMFEAGQTNLCPTIYSFTTVMDAYASQRHPAAGEYAERLVQTMRKLKRKYNAKDLDINTGVMNTVLNCYLASGNPKAGHRANELVKDMEKRSDIEGEKDVQPNARTYSLVMSIWSKLETSDKAEQTLRVLMHTEERARDSKLPQPNHPNDFLHAIVMNACAFTTGDEDAEKRAFQIAVQVLTEVTNDGSKFSVASNIFAWFFQACGRLRIDKALKEENLQRAFDVCCAKGLVNDFVLARFVEAASDELLEKTMRPILHKVMGVKDTSMREIRQKLSLYHLPADWKRSYQKLKGTVRRAPSNYQNRKDSY
jgi:pentatricopeptide repeat protein